MAKSTFSMVYGSPTSIWGLEDSCVLISWIFLCFSYHDMEFSPYFIHLFFSFIMISFCISLSFQRQSF